MRTSATTTPAPTTRTRRPANIPEDEREHHIARVTAGASPLTREQKERLARIVSRK